MSWFESGVRWESRVSVGWMEVVVNSCMHIASFGLVDGWHGAESGLVQIHLVPAFNVRDCLHNCENANEQTLHIHHVVVFDLGVCECAQVCTH
jgi:hypothetical protein